MFSGGISTFFRSASRSRLALRLLSLLKNKYSNKHGIVMIQIDGLSRKQLEKAMQAGKMPFLKKILKDEDFTIKKMYSGVPSTTPSVQGELFYGVKQAVPAFGYFDRALGEPVSMMSSENSAKVEDRLRREHRSIFEEGSSHGNIYGMGALTASFCMNRTGLAERIKKVSLLRLAVVAMLYGMSWFRVLFSLVPEFFLAAYDLVHGVSKGMELKYELSFLPKRVLISSTLSELTTLSSCLEVAEGLPLVHCNFFTYDEQAHRRGPDSAFAHWSLKSIDKHIRRIWKTAHKAGGRNYDFILYSDHGQEATDSYDKATGGAIDGAIEDCAEKTGLGTGLVAESPVRASMFRLQLFSKRLSRAWKDMDTRQFNTLAGLVFVCMGPLGHLYIVKREARSEKTRKNIARRLVRDYQVPLVIYLDDLENARYFNHDGEGDLVSDARRVMGEDHPYAKEVSKDLRDLLKHENAGELILSGWKTGGRPLSFSIENGAHGGPGSQETDAFLILPKDFALSGKEFIRPVDLRREVMREVRVFRHKPKENKLTEQGTLRVTTYNIHSGEGLDGRLDLKRIARVISKLKSDVVLLQEVDKGCRRSAEEDQLAELQKHTGFEYSAFFPVTKMNGGEYGIAVLSSLPLSTVKSENFQSILGREPRGAQWLRLSLTEGSVDLLNTHLGLRPRERNRQVKELLGENWMGSREWNLKRCVFAGDLNALPGAPVHRLLSKDMHETQHLYGIKRKIKTWRRLSALDYVYASKETKVSRVYVPKNSLAAKASDHLPLTVDLILKKKDSEETKKQQDSNVI